MKKLSIYDDVHKDVKVEAAKEEASVPLMASELLRWAVKEKRAGRCKMPDFTKPTAPSRK